MNYSCAENTSARFSVSAAKIIPIRDGKVHWSLLNWGEEMQHYEQIEIFRRVFEFYNHELWPIQFLSTSDPDQAYFKICYVKADNIAHLNDGQKIACPFNFIENPEAIAVFHMNTGNKWSGWCFINETYYFDKAHNVGRTDLYKVMVHELGHGLGLNHTEAPGDIMLPVYDPGNDFTADSRAGLNKIFGSTRRSLMKTVSAAEVLRAKRKCFLFP